MKRDLRILPAGSALPLLLLMAASCGDDSGAQMSPSTNVPPAGSGAAGSSGAQAAAGGPSATAGASGTLATGGRSGSTGAAAGSSAAGSGGASGSAGSLAAGSGGAGGESAAAGSPAAGASGAAGTGTAGSTGGSAFPAVSDLGADGPFKAMTMTGGGPGGAYTLFFPQELGKDGVKHPFITWGNGATTTPGLFTLLPRLATHGFVVIASDNAFVTSAEMKAGLDWLVMENARAGSPFHQKLDEGEVASMGYSLGSLGTFEIAADPRLKTTVHISGGAMNKSVVPNLRNPAAFICGDESDIAHANCETDFEMAKVPVFYAVFPGEHLGILGANAPQINKAATAWLRWRLMHDTSLDAMFVGADCTLCKDSAWVVKQKDLDTAP